MSKRRRRKRATDGFGDIGAVFAELGLKYDDYEVDITFTKGAISGGRGTVVAVTHRASGRRKRLSDVSGTKRDAHLKSAAVLRRCLLALTGRA